VKIICAPFHGAAGVSLCRALWVLIFLDAINNMLLSGGSPSKSDFTCAVYGRMRCSLPQYATTLFRMQTAKGASIYNTAQNRKSLQSVCIFFHILYGFSKISALTPPIHPAIFVALRNE
jgi:hypothetical protein